MRIGKQEGDESMQINRNTRETEGENTIVLAEKTEKGDTEVVVRAPGRAEEELWKNLRREAAAVFLRRLQR